MAKKKKEEKSVDIHDIKECPDCASQNIVYNDERQQVICRDCGLIYEPLTPEAEAKFESSHEFRSKPRIAWAAIPFWVMVPTMRPTSQKPGWIPLGAARAYVKS